MPSSIILFVCFALFLSEITQGFKVPFCRNTISPPSNIAILPGSGVSPSLYNELTKEIEASLPEPVSIINLNYFPLQSLPNNTLIIGHSFGGFVGLLYCLRENLFPDSQKNISGCILINSHFNHRNKMPYPAVKMQFVPVPVLVLLNVQDEKLPLKKAMDDFEVAKEKNLTHIKFHFNVGDHTSTFTNPNETKKAADQIVSFLTKTT